MSLFKIILVIYVIGSMIAVHVLFSTVFFGRSKWTVSSDWPNYENYPGYERISFQFLSGKNRLQAYIYGAENSKALVVISHGLGNAAEGHMADIVWFVDHGYRVFSYNSTGTHTSEGKGTRGMAQSALDLNAALTYIEGEDELKNLPVLLYGHSWGAYAAAAVLAKPIVAEPLEEKKLNIAAAVCISGYNTPNGIVWEHSRRMAGPLAIPGYPFMVLENFFRFGRASTIAAVDSINASSIPVLIIHGTGDTVVPFNRSSIISRRDSITNPSVEYFIRDREGQNGHNDLFLFMGELDEEFMNRINTFYEKHLHL